MAVELQLRQSQVQIVSQEMQESLHLLELPSLELLTYLTEQTLVNPLLDMSSGDDQSYKEKEIPAVEGLTEFLLRQLGLLEVQEGTTEIVKFLIGSLDSNGYLRTSISDIAEDLQVSAEEVTVALEILQAFEPAGIGARTLSECLLLQLSRSGIRDGLVVAVVQDYLHDVANGSLKKIASERQCSIEEIQVVVEFIRSLDPRPGQTYSSWQTIYIRPDIYVRKIDGEFLVLINEQVVPLLNVNREYVQLINDPLVDLETKRYLRSKYTQAIHVIRNLQRRNMTIVSITEVLVEQQRAFFENGIEYLRPLTREEVAKRLDMHISTVSRAVRDKYISTPFGTFPLAFFFSSSLTGDSGRVSSTSVKNLLRELVAEENPFLPHTDGDLQALLVEKGLTISRRTVAKYRNQLGIPPAKVRIKY